MLRARESNGFTLVEAVVAGLILVVGVLGSAAVFDSSRRQSATGERQQIASELVQAELERIRDIPYDELGTDGSAGWADSGGPGDPSARVDAGAGTLRVSQSATEELVLAAAGAGLAPVSSGAFQSGDATLDFDTYRFVSWRDEECPLVDLSDLITEFDSLTGPAETALNALFGPGTPLNSLLGLTLGGSFGPVKVKLNLAASIGASIEDEVAQLNETLNGLDEIDPCDADLQALSELQETVSAMNPLLGSLSSAIASYNNACLRVAGVAVSCPSLGSATGSTLNSAITNVQNGDFADQLDALTASVGDLGLNDHPYNTKRVTVAVVLEPRIGSGPSKPVWASSVVSDPDSGLLTSP